MAEPYASFVELTSVVDLDVPRLLPLSCLLGRTWNHFDSLVSMTATPFVLFAVGSGLVTLKYRRDTSRGRRNAHNNFRYYFARVMLLAVSHTYSRARARARARARLLF